MLLTTGSYELLESDCLAIYESALESGVSVRLVDAYGMFHVYPIIAPDTPEGKEAWEEIGALFKRICYDCNCFIQICFFCG
jgi:acetyl esterase/lipase